MTGSLIKICGVTDTAALDAAAAAGASHVGFVFFGKSPRHLAHAHGAALARHAAPALKRVTLLVDPSDDEIDAAIAAIKPHALQLHGRETPQRVAAIRQHTGLEIWKALPLTSKGDLASVDTYPAADRILFDAKPPIDATRPGGNGVAFDWSIVTGYRPSKSWVLSGGLDPLNVTAAIAATGATAVDISTGVESAPGLKDPVKIAAFIRAAAAAFAPPVLEPQS